MTNKERTEEVYESIVKAMESTDAEEIRKNLWRARFMLANILDDMDEESEE